MPTCWPTPSCAARERDPRLHLVLAGGGPEEDALRERLGEHATFLGWLEGDELARAYASADVFLFASRTDTFGQVLLEAQASGLPVVAVAEGGPDADRGRPHGPAARLPASWPTQCASWRARRSCAAAWRQPRWPPCGRGPGRARWSSSRDGYRAALVRSAGWKSAERVAA